MDNRVNLQNKYVKYLRNNNYAENTIRNYTSGINFLNNKMNANIFLCKNLDELNAIFNNFTNNKELVEYDNKIYHRGIQSAFKLYIKFVENLDNQDLADSIDPQNSINEENIYDELQGSNHEKLLQDVSFENKEKDLELNDMVVNENKKEIQIFDWELSTLEDEGYNQIVYGTPGCGKSTYVKNVLTKDFAKDNVIRTTFYQDYTYTDFVGQILPTIKEDGSVTYIFNPGPFTLALQQAIKYPNEKVAFIIEEINRGNAASIFGDIF